MCSLLAIATAVAPGVVYQNPADYAVLSSISICAGNVAVQQDPRFATLLPAQSQTLPVDYVSDWPVWVCKPPTSSEQQQKVPVVRIPVPEPGEDPLSSWANPCAFEQLWLPDDLPTPKARAAIGLVLRLSLIHI